MQWSGLPSTYRTKVPNQEAYQGPDDHSTAKVPGHLLGLPTCKVSITVPWKASGSTGPPVRPFQLICLPLCGLLPGSHSAGNQNTSGQPVDREHKWVRYCLLRSTCTLLHANRPHSAYSSTCTLHANFVPAAFVLQEQCRSGTLLLYGVRHGKSVCRLPNDPGLK